MAPTPPAPDKKGSFPLMGLLLAIGLGAGATSVLSKPDSTTIAEGKGATSTVVSPNTIPGSPRSDLAFDGCPMEGDGGDPLQNRLKNRTDMPERFYDVSLASIISLPWPVAATLHKRSQWSSSLKSEVWANEGKPVRVIGYLAHLKVEGPETPNCHGSEEKYRDWHIGIASVPTSAGKERLIIETTPRVRSAHPEWDKQVVNKIIDQKIPVRISGWLMFDPAHPEEVGKSRATLWEIHPIMTIEVREGNAWRPLINKQ